MATAAIPPIAPEEIIGFMNVDQTDFASFTRASSSSRDRCRSLSTPDFPPVRCDRTVSLLFEARDRLAKDFAWRSTILTFNSLTCFSRLA